jgi:DNA-binding MarR family transcriptional regulator
VQHALNHPLDFGDPGQPAQDMRAIDALEEAEFQVLREALSVSDSVLSKQISQLADAGYVKLRKAAIHGRQRTWARLTVRGRKALAAHVEALPNLASAANGGGT